MFRHFGFTSCFDHRMLLTRLSGGALLAISRFLSVLPFCHCTITCPLDLFLVREKLCHLCLRTLCFLWFAAVHFYIIFTFLHLDRDVLAHATLD